MSDSRIVADALSECAHHVHRCKSLYRDLEASAGQLIIAHNKLQNLAAHLQSLEASLEANDAPQIQTARDLVRTTHSEVQRFFFEQDRNISANLRAFGAALDKTVVDGVALIAARNLLSIREEPAAAGATRDITPGEWDALATGVILARAPPGTKVKFMGAMLSTGA